MGGERRGPEIEKVKSLITTLSIQYSESSDLTATSVHYTTFDFHETPTYTSGVRSSVCVKRYCDENILRLIILSMFVNTLHLKFQRPFIYQA